MMATPRGEAAFGTMNKDLDFDVLIIGGGLSGLYSLHKMRTLGLRALVLEDGGDLGGTWYWNRYPGARFDSESYSYIFSFSKELLDEWSWTEHFAAQPETLRYCQFIADKFDLRRDMQFNTRVKAAHYQQTSSSWLLIDESGRQYSSRFLITAMGVLNNFSLPNIPGVNDFKGASFHTARWPHEPVQFENKRVAVIGTGATGIQAIQEIAKTAGHLTVLQRTPNWSAPLRNSKISPEEMDEIRARYPEIFECCSNSYAGFMHYADYRKTYDVTPEEQQELWERLYAGRGFGKWLGNFSDMGFDRRANDLYSNYMANKIRERINDPITAEKLIPKCHGFGTKRVPLESGYFEVFNQPNVRLLDIKEDPIERITEKGIKTRDEDLEFDIIVYATGFDAITGSFTAVDFRGIDGIMLSDVWRQGLKTFLGLFVEGFPNMTMIMGPHQMFGNIPRSIEYAVNWVGDFLRYCRDNNITYAEATHKGVEEWTQHVLECSVGLLSNEVDSWMTGINKNLAYKQQRSVVRYNGSAPGYRKRTGDVAARNYEDLKLRGLETDARL